MSRLVSVHAGVLPVPYGQVALVILTIVEISQKQAFLQDFPGFLFAVRSLLLEDPNLVPG